MKRFAALPLALLAAAGTAGAALAAGDAVKGETAFLLCRACHTGQPGAIGPDLAGVVGRTAGSDADFAAYSAGMKALHDQNLVWNDETLDEYLSNPGAMVPGSVMPATPDAQQRADLIAYLKTLPAQ